MPRSLLALSLLLALSGCADSRSPLPTTPATSQGTGPPYGPTGSLTVSGLAFRDEGGGRQPVPRAKVEVRVSLGTFEYYFGTFGADSVGGYKVAGLPPGRVSFYGYGAEHRQPCSRILDLASDATLDLELVTAQRPSPSDATPHIVAGLVFQKTADGREPVAGAQVGIERWFDEVIAGTWTDAAGRYVLCGLPPGETVSVFAQQGSRLASTPFYTVTGDRTVDIELPLPR